MTADILDAVATYLGDVSAFPVYYPDMPRDLPQDASAMDQFAVITPGGNAGSAGDRSYVQVARPRADIRCYGPNMYRALEVERDLAGLLKALRPTTVSIGGGNLPQTGVRLHNATRSAGPVSMIDPDTQWPLAWASWGVHGSEIEIETDTGMFSSMFSEMFA